MMVAHAQSIGCSFALCVLSAFASTGTLAQEGTITVRGRGRIALSLTQSASSVEVVGHLGGDRDERLAGESLSIQAVGETTEHTPVTLFLRQVRSNSRGDFRTTFYTNDALLVQAAWEGNELFAGARERAWLRGNPLEAELLAPEEADLATETTTLELTLQSVGEPRVSCVRIENELAQRVGENVCGVGAHSVEVPTSTLGPPGEGTLRVVAEGSDEALVERPIVRFVRAELQSSLAENTSFAHDFVIAIDGSLTAVRHDGHPPMVSETVLLFADDQRVLAQTTTDELGRFRFAVPAETFAAGNHVFQLEYVSNFPRQRGATLTVPFSVRSPFPWRWIAAAALLLVAFVLVGWRPRPKAAVATPDVHPLAPPVFLSAAGTTTHREVVLQIQDARTREPIDGWVRLSEEREIASENAHVRFRLAATEDVEVCAAHHMRTPVRIESPHQGEWLLAVISLVHVRDAAQLLLTKIVGHERSKTTTLNEWWRSLDEPGRDRFPARLRDKFNALAFAETVPSEADIQELSDWIASSQARLGADDSGNR